MAYRMEFSRTVTKLLSNFEESQLLDISPGHGCMLVDLAFANSITCGGQKKKGKWKKKRGRGRKGNNWNCANDLALHPLDEHMFHREQETRNRTQLSHSHSKPEPTLNHSWSQLKEPQRAPIRREKFTVLGLWDGTQWFPKRSLPKGFSRMTRAALHVLLTHRWPLEPSLVQESTPTSIHGQRDWQVLQCLTNPEDFYRSLIYVHVTAVTPSESLTWPKGQIIIPFNCDKSP